MRANLYSNIFRFNVALDRVAPNTIDTTALADAIKKAVFLSMDGRLSEGKQGALNALALRLRDQLRELLVQVFDAGSAELHRASEALMAVNRSLDAAKEDIAHIADTVEGMGKLTGAIDKLLATVGVFL